MNSNTTSNSLDTQVTETVSDVSDTQTNVDTKTSIVDTQADSLEALIEQELKNAKLQLSDNQMDKVNRYDMPPRVTTDNIVTFLQPVQLNNNDSNDVLLRIILKYMLDMLNYIEDKESELYTVENTMRILCEFLPSLHNNKNLAVLVKAKFDEFIVKNSLHQLIPYYNKIFSDKMYDNISNRSTPGEIYISKDEIDLFTEIYNREVADRVKKLNSLRKPLKFEEEEIVGAKDKEGKWWMAKILKIYSYKEHNVYYVEFLGWGSKFNEFITDTYRIERFNPRKHIYYRPAFKKLQLEKEYTEDNMEELEKHTEE